MKILLATDGSEYSQAAVDSVAERPWPKGSVVKIVSVMEIPYAPTTEGWALPNSYYRELEKVAREQAQSAITAAVERFKSVIPLRVEVSAKIISGSPKQVIMEEAEKWSADLIVVGSRGYSGWQRLLLGSVSHAVATHAHCSVEIVRQKQDAKK
jgi:nucleotide-binding universal stress UspA family protein